MKKLLKMKRTLESVSQADPQTKGDSELDTGAADPPRTIFSDSDIAELRLQLRMHESCKFVSGDLMNRDSHGHWNGHVTATSHPGSHYAASVIIVGVSEMVLTSCMLISILTGMRILFHSKGHCALPVLPPSFSSCRLCNPMRDAVLQYSKDSGVVQLLRNSPCTAKPCLLLGENENRLLARSRTPFKHSLHLYHKWWTMSCRSSNLKQRSHPTSKKYWI